MRVAIVDDSRLARLELKQQLVDFDGIEVAFEAATVAETLEHLVRTPVDVILLDIDLPDGNGFDILEQAETVPQIIFVTAFDEYAIKSFEFNALDYLLKPVRQVRLKAAIDKVQQDQQQIPLSADRRIFIKDGERCFFVSVNDIYAFEAMGNYTQVHLHDDKASVYRPIGAIAERLDPNHFFRASRSWIINAGYVSSIQPGVGSGFQVTLQNGLEVAISKRQAAEFRRCWSL